MRGTKFSITLSLSVVGLSLFLVGCGKSDAVNPTIGAPGSMAPTMPALPTMPIADFCRSKAGTLVTDSATGKQVCKVTQYIVAPGSVQYRVFSGMVATPQVTPSNPVGGPSAWQMGVQLRKNDKLVYAGRSSWGLTKVNSSSALGGLFRFTTYSTNCNMVSGTGAMISGSGTLAPTDGSVPGLFASDQKKAYLIGNGATVTIENDGNLVIGFNIPEINLACGEIEINQLRIDRCIDSANVTYACN